jgi:hypothetical protein
MRHYQPSDTPAGVVTLADMPDLLTWRRTYPLDGLHARHLKAAEDAFARMLREIRERHERVGAALHAKLESLSWWMAARVVAAPEMIGRLRTWRAHPAETVRFLAGALNAEAALAAGTDLEPGQWTALGDFYVARDSDRPIDLRTGAWQDGRSFAAPRLDGLIPLDCSSPNVETCRLQGDREEASPADIRSIDAMLQRALALIEAACPATADAIRWFVKVVVVAKSVGAPKGHSSSSSPSHRGRVLLRDCHVAAVEGLMDSLVHEATHQVLYAVECTEHLADDVNAPLLVSPWSGTPLTVHSYVQACFVWYSLAHFWRAAMQWRALNTQPARACLDRALRGFRAGNPAEALVPHGHRVSPAAIAVIHQLHDRIGVHGPLPARGEEHTYATSARQRSA